MFEIGKPYEIKMLVDGEEETLWSVVEKYEPPVLKLEDHVTPEGDRFFQPGTIYGQIINVTSPNFISAVRKEGR